ncbi:DNA helicase-primase complex component [Harp seal herpesvirus]|uniref:DNA helicase-primase complex component n=1 Tax=phocid gammaherpesvirus 3 TaxID=2560643 RepID=A0A0R5XSW2_9GAMA|nr:DNA helicase-primase complex component [Harp seal herpesvirus]AJG42968.1 DNA helicase-primase complex component [Harp seal herpesvirus]
MEDPGCGFILNMTSDAKVRLVVSRIKKLSQKTTSPPEMSWYDSEFDPEDCPGPFLPFTTYLVTGTAGAGKSTSISALYQNLNCLITGATTVAAQNLSQGLRAYCPTIYNAFGFKSRHINILNRQVPKTAITNIQQIQHQELCKYWPVISDILKDFMKKKQKGQYANLNNQAFQALSRLGTPALWTTNVIVIDEAGTLSSHILTAVVFFYWFYNSWLETPLYKNGVIPCIVCVGSPTQTDAFQSTFNHLKQKHQILECDNVLTFLIKNQVVSDYVQLNHNWALFINNKRCTDPEFGHLLKTLEYNLNISTETMDYIDRFVVPRSKIVNPLEYTGWTRLFVSHNEVKSYLTSLHTALSASTDSESKLFTCPIVCEVFTQTFEEYKEAVHLSELTVTQWLQKNLCRLSNYSQFIDQDMTAISTETTEDATRVTYLVNYVKNSFVSVNGKTKKCVCGYTGTFNKFKAILDSESFIESHAHDQPEYVYSFLNTLLYNGMYMFYKYGVDACNKEFLQKLFELPIPSNLTSFNKTPHDMDHAYLTALNPDQDIFYHLVQPPPSSSAASLPLLLSYYTALKDIFMARLQLAIEHMGSQFLHEEFITFTANIMVIDGVNYTSTADRLHGLLDFASTVESYKLKGYTFVPVSFGRFNQNTLSKHLHEKMPVIVVEDSFGFISCLENNINKLTETVENGNMFHICSVGDYGISSKLAMTIVKAQGMSLHRVAVCFGSHKNLKKSLVYVAISRATNPAHLVLDCNPLKLMDSQDQSYSASHHIIQAIHNPNTLLIY